MYEIVWVYHRDSRKTFICRLLSYCTDYGHVIIAQERAEHTGDAAEKRRGPADDGVEESDGVQHGLRRELHRLLARVVHLRVRLGLRRHAGRPFAALVRPFLQSAVERRGARCRAAGYPEPVGRADTARGYALRPRVPVHGQGVLEEYVGDRVRQQDRSDGQHRTDVGAHARHSQVIGRPTKRNFFSDFPMKKTICLLRDFGHQFPISDSKFHLLRPVLKSKLTVDTKIAIYKSLLRPIWTYTIKI